MFTILASQFAYSQDFIRAGVAGSTKSDFIHGYSIYPQGDLLNCGTFQRTIDLDFENGSQSLMTAISKYDIYVAKYDITGNYIWPFQLGGDPNHYAFVKDITTDMDGSIFITGTSDGWIVTLRRREIVSKRGPNPWLSWPNTFRMAIIFGPMGLEMTIPMSVT